MADVYGMKRILDIAKEYSLPDWWVLSVIIEYFDCRRYAENGRVWTFDFDKPSQQDIKTIPEKKVVIPGYILMQNIRPDDLSTLASLHEAKLPVGSLEDPNFVPIGLANNTAFPGIKFSIRDLDPKLIFGGFAVVLDDGFFYQWYIEETKTDNKRKYSIPGLSEIRKNEKKLLEYQNLLSAKQPDQQLKTDIEAAYKELEKARERLRQEILDYHNKRAKNLYTSRIKVPKPPEISYFNTIELTEDGCQTQPQMAPIFLRSATRNLHNAKEVKRRHSSNNKNDGTREELEYSAICIISAASCLEEYISYVISRYLSAESKIFKRASHKQKWLWVPAALNLPFRFKPVEEPYCSFSSVVTWRNNAIHHKAEYDKVKDGISRASNQLNVKNAKTAVRVVNDMITKLSEGGRIPLPTWIKTHDASAAYWDEV